MSHNELRPVSPTFTSTTPILKKSTSQLDLSEVSKVKEVEHDEHELSHHKVLKKPSLQQTHGLEQMKKEVNDQNISLDSLPLVLEPFQGIGSSSIEVVESIPIQLEKPINTVPSVNLTDIFTGIKSVDTFKDQPFTSKEEALAIESFVQIKGDRLEISRNFKEGLDVLAYVDPNGVLFKGVVEDLQNLEKGIKTDCKSLKSFIEYQVFKTGDHQLTQDELKWSKDLAKGVLDLKPGYKENGVTEELLANELQKHYMCKCCYSKPSDTLIRRDLPDFVSDRLRVKDTGVTAHIFKTSNGCSIAYDPKLHTVEEVEELFKTDLDTYKTMEGSKIEFVPFDSKKFIIASVQVPVMEKALTVQVQTLEHGLVDVVMGEDPKTVGYEMTEEPAGVFKRSFNSQRVIEILGTDHDGREVAFQLKGSGVPEYGFLNDGMTGGEFFKLTVEKGAMGLRDFAETVFNNPDIAPNMGGMALAMGQDKACSGGNRKGAISFRLDYSKGIRAGNLLPQVQKSMFGLKASEDLTLYTEMSKKTGIIPDEKWKKDLLNTVAKNLAQTHLFGMNYDDSSLRTLEDLGVKGEFSDSGSLRNILPLQPIDPDLTTLYTGLNQKLGPDIASKFKETYLIAVMDSLKEIGAKNGEEASVKMKGLLGEVMDTIGTNQKPNKKKFDPEFNLPELSKFLTEFCASLGDDLNKTPLIQQAFHEGGLEGYSTVLFQKLEAKVSGLHEFRKAAILEQGTSIGSLDKAMEKFGITTETGLKKALGIAEDAEFPEGKIAKLVIEKRGNEIVQHCEAGTLADALEKYAITTESGLKKFVGMKEEDVFPEGTIADQVTLMKETGKLV